MTALSKRHPEDPTTVGEIWRFIYAAVTFLLAVVVVIAWLPISLMFRIYRTTVVGMVKKKMGDVMMASGGDAVWLQDSKENLCIINSVLGIKGSPYDINVFRKHVRDRMVDIPDPDDSSKPYFPKMQMHTIKEYHRDVWINEKNFDINEHVYMLDKAIPDTKEELQGLIGELSSQPLPTGKSPWEVIVIPYKNNNSDKFYLIFRIHHSIGDGVSLVKTFASCLSDKPPEEPKSHRFGTQNLWMKIVQTIVEGPGLILATTAKYKDQNILHGPRLSGEKFVAWSSRLQLDRIKKMKSSTGTTVNDVLMSCLAAAFRTYMVKNSSIMPKDICACIPVDMRQSKKVQMDNQFSLIIMDLPLDEEDPLVLLMRTQKRMKLVKASPEPLLNNLFMRYSMARLPSRLTKSVLDWFSSKCSFVLSNVPGPSQKLSIQGQDVEDVIFWPPQRVNIALGISILSYNEGLRIGVMSDKAVLTKPSVLVDLFVDKVNELAAQLKVE